MTSRRRKGTDPARVLPRAVFETVLFYVDAGTLLRSVPYVSRAWHAAGESEALWRRKYLATWRACLMPPAVRRAHEVLRALPTAQVPPAAVAAVRAYRARADRCRCGMCDAPPFRCISSSSKDDEDEEDKKDKGEEEEDEDKDEDEDEENEEEKDEGRPLTHCGWKGSFFMRMNVEEDLFGEVFRGASSSTFSKNGKKSSSSSSRSALKVRARAVQKYLRRAAESISLVAGRLTESPAARPREAVDALSQAALRRHERAAAHCGVPPSDAMYGVAEELLRTAFSEGVYIASGCGVSSSSSSKHGSSKHGKSKHRGSSKHSKSSSSKRKEDQERTPVATAAAEPAAPVKENLVTEAPVTMVEERDHELWEEWASTRVNRALALSLGAPDAVRDLGLTLARFRAAAELCAALTARFRSAEVLLLWAKALYQEANVVLDDERGRAERLLRRAWALHGAVLAATPEPESGLYNSMADTAELLSQTQLTAARIDQWFELALSRYVAARARDPQNSAIVNNFALAFHNHAFLKTGEPARELLRGAISFYEEALRFGEDKYIVLYNQGDALTQLSHITPDADTAERYFARAVACYEESCRINPRYHSSFNNWGWAWLERANRAAAPADAERYLERAAACFARALQLRPGYHISISNCGNVALERACRHNRPADWDAALGHYRRALALKPRFVKAHHYIGLLRMERARRLPLQGKDKDSNRDYAELRAEGFRACLAACQQALAVKPCYPLCAFTAAQAAVLLGDRATAARMIDIYNTITGAVAEADEGALPLSLEVFDKHNSNLSFNFKSYPWLCG